MTKQAPDGSFVWAHAMGGSRGLGISVDYSGNVYTTGYFSGTADFDPRPGTFELTSAGSDDIFVSKLDTNGDFVWARAMGGMLAVTWSQGIAVDGGGNVCTTGRFSGTVDFDPGPGTFNLTSAGHYDIFVWKLSGPLNTTPPNAIAIAPDTTGPTNAASVASTVTFDEPVQGFDDSSDLVVTHTGTTSTGATVDGGPAVYTVTVEGLGGDGSFTVAVRTDGDVADLAGNLLASSVVSAPVVVDNTPPTITALSVSPSALRPGDEALIQFSVSEMLLGDPVVRVAGTAASEAPLETAKSLGHSYRWTAPADAPVGQITGRHFVTGVGYFNPDPWPYGPRPVEITVTDLAGNTTVYTEAEGIALVSGLPTAWPGLAVLALIGAAGFAFRVRRAGRAKGSD